MRIHITFPDDLVEGIDQIVGNRRRSAFIAQAVRERVRLEQVLRLLKESAGILKEENYPHWATPKNVARWVRNLRRQSVG